MSTINNMTNLELVQLLGDLIVRLNLTNFGPETDLVEVHKYDQLSDKLTVYLRKIVREGRREDTKEFIKHTNSLKEINEELLKTLGQLDQFAQTLKTLVDFVRVVEKLLKIATPVLGGISPFAATKKRATLSLTDKTLYRLDPAVVERLMGAVPPEKDAVDGLPEDVSVEQVSVEEVLHGIELTPERLIITVATGGCTEEGSFHVEVNKGYKKLLPYLVTVYRIKPDDCKKKFEPIRISFSRKELGLEGNVDFRVLNRIGNTSQHLLLP